MKRVIVLVAAALVGCQMNQPSRQADTGKRADAGKHHHDALRVLSERAYADPDAINAEMRRLGADADAAEVKRLIKR